jgi:SAM-dependent methyltransferase
MVMGPDRLAGAIEMMDLPDADPAELARTLSDLAWINRWLGGRRLILHHLAPLLDGRAAPIRILDVGTGCADVPRAIARWARGRQLPVEIEGIDHHGRIAALARQRSTAYPEIRIRNADALSLPYPDGSFDIVIASLVLHHMEGEDQVRLLRELYRVARRAVLVNDLRRGYWPFVVTWASLHALSRSRLILHDGPLSVRRSFLPAELLALARRAGWERARVSHHAFFRLALVGKKGL